MFVVLLRGYDFLMASLLEVYWCETRVYIYGRSQWYGAAVGLAHN